MPSVVTGEIKLKQGESTTIALKGSATAGYLWNYTTDDHKDCIKVSKEFAQPEKSAQKNTGASVDEIFIITALKKGAVNIHFSHKRSWEKNIDPVHEKKIKIIVE